MSMKPKSKQEKLQEHDKKIFFWKCIICNKTCKQDNEAIKDMPRCPIFEENKSLQ